MRTSITLLFALPLAACAPTNDDPSDTSDTDDAVAFEANPTRTFGGDRPAALVRPDDYAPDRAWPLIVLLHGYGANATVQDMVFGLGTRIERDDFLLLKPEGTVDTAGRPFWNATDACCNFYGSDVDDVGYLAGLVDEVRAVYPVSQVSFVGHSNGGYMSYRMACERPDLVDRIVVLAGATFFDETDCVGDTPVSVAHAHGTLDPTIVYLSAPTHAGAEESARRWATKAGCDEPPTRLADRDHLSNMAGEETIVQRWSGCAPDVDVELWSGVGGDHFYLTRTARFQDDVAAFALGRPAD